MPTLTPEQLRTRILAILEPIHAFDPVLDSLYELVSQGEDLPMDVLEAVNGMLSGLLASVAGKLDGERSLAVQETIRHIRELEAADRESVEDPVSTML